MIKDLEIKNFRGLKKIKLQDLKRFNLFIGDNGSGKTSILDALFVSINPNNPTLLPRTNRFRNIENVDYSSFFKMFFNDFNFKNAISITNKINGREFSTKIYPKFEQLEGYPKDADSEIETKISGMNLDFKFRGKKYQAEIELKKDLNNQKTNLFQDPFVVKTDDKFKAVISGTYLNSFNANDLRNITSRLNDALEKKKKLNVIEFLKKYRDTISDVYINETGGIMITDDKFPIGVPLNIYGDGLVRGLSIFLSSLEGNDIILYDEIENGLHWSKQQEVFSSMNEIAETLGNQYFITTHSQDAIKNLYQVANKLNFVDNFNVFRIENKEGEIEVIKLLEKDLKYYMENKIEIR